MISFVSPLERVLIELICASGRSASELRNGGQLQHRHGLLQDADGALTDLLLFRFGAVAEAGVRRRHCGFRFGVRFGVRGAVVFAASEGNL